MNLLKKLRSVGVLRNRIRIKAITTLRLWDGATGRTLVYDVLDPGNLVVTAGLALVADQMLDTPALAKPTYMAVGSGAVAPALADTALGTEIYRAALGSKTRSGAAVTYFRSFTAGQGTGSLTEMGIFNMVSAGTMLCRQTFGTKTKGANDVLDITLQHTFA